VSKTRVEQAPKTRDAATCQPALLVSTLATPRATPLATPLATPPRCNEISTPNAKDGRGRRTGLAGHDSLREAALLDIMQREASSSSSSSSPPSARDPSGSPAAASASGASEAGAGRLTSRGVNPAGAAGGSDAQVWFGRLRVWVAGAVVAGLRGCRRGHARCGRR